MISRLRGIPAGRTVDGLVVDVGGVGYLVSATPSVMRRADDASARTRSSSTGSPTRPSGRSSHSFSV